MVCNPTFNTSTNHFASRSYYTYDANGNLTEDPNATEFAYDAENRHMDVKEDKDTVKGQYFYDGDGKRVKKIVALEIAVLCMMLVDC